MTFPEWLARQRNRRSPVGDLADDVADDRCFPRDGDFQRFLAHMWHHGCCAQAEDALRQAWRSYQAFTKRRHAPYAPETVQTGQYLPHGGLTGYKKYQNNCHRLPHRYTSQTRYPSRTDLNL
jgi:uncharacterized protein YozE (UPF0346 family)